MNKNDHRNNYTVYLLAAVAPLMDFLLDRQLIFNTNFIQQTGYFFLRIHLDKHCIPGFRARFAVVCPIGKRSVSHYFDWPVHKFSCSFPVCLLVN